MGVVTGMNMARAAGPGAVQAGKRVGPKGVEGLFKPVGGKRKAGLQSYAGRHVGKRDTLSAFGVDHGEIAKAFRLPFKKAPKSGINPGFGTRKATLTESNTRTPGQYMAREKKNVAAFGSRSGRYGRT